MSKIVELGPFSPDVTEVVRQLKRDIKDDFHPDSLGYEDILTSNTAAELLSESIERNHGLFVPEGRTELNIPKPGFVLRYSLDMSLLDRLYYQALVGHLVPYYDPLLPNQVLSHRYAGSDHRSGRYLYKHPIEQWKLFQRYTALEARSKPVILATDIVNYFENIQVARIISVLEDNIYRLKASGSAKAQLRRIVTDLNRCLQKWCYKPSHGLPQNRDASSFLSNLVMLPVDESMIRHGYTYFRYMDDIRIAATSRYQARAALQHLTIELRRLGLNVNSAKTIIVEPGMQRYAKTLGENEPLLTNIDNMWNSKSLPVIRRSFAPLQRLALDLIERGATDERGFRFCVQRLESLALCPELAVPSSFFQPMIDLCIKALDTQPFSSDKIVRFLKAAPTSSTEIGEVAKLLMDHNRAIYDWQNYLLWQLLTCKNHADPALTALAKHRAGQVERPADRAGAILFLGAMGSDDDRRFIAKSFESYKDHIIQRNALIAVHQIDFNEGIKANVAPHVLPSLKGTYRRLHRDFPGEYYRPLPSVSALKLYDELSGYD